MYRVEGEADAVLKVDFKGDQLEKLRKYLKDEYDKAKRDREPMMKNAKLWLQQANSRRKRPDARLGDSNIDMPLTKKRLIQNSSRLKNPVLSQDRVYVCGPRTAIPETAKMSEEVEDALDYLCAQFDIREFLGDWIKQFQIFPLGVIKTPFIQEYDRFVQWVEIPAQEYMDYKGMQGKKPNIMKKEFDTGEIKYYVEIEEDIPVKQGPEPCVVPFEDFIVPFGTSGVNSADVIFHRTAQSRKTVARKITKGLYNEKDGDEKVLDKISKPSYQHEPLIVYNDNGDNKSVQSTGTQKKHYEIVEAYLEWDTDDDETYNEIIVVFEATTGTFLRAIHNFYQSYRRPFIVHQYEHVIGSIYGDSLAFALEPLHVANSASFNQRLDAASLANETMVFVPPNSSIERVLNRSEFRTGVYQVNFDVGEAKQFNLSQPFTQLPELEDKMERSADEVSSLTPNSFGFEQVERPTAAGTIHLSEESKQPQYDQLERFRGKLALLAFHMLSRSRQFFPEGLTYYLQQETEDGRQALEQAVLNWPPHSLEKDVVIKTKVSSASMSKQLRKQETLALLDKLQPVYGQMLELARSASNIQDPAAPVSYELLVGYQKAVSNMMEEFEVADRDILNPELLKGVNLSVQYQQSIQELQGRLQQAIQYIGQLRGQVPGSGGPPGPTSPPQAGGVPSMGRGL